MIKIKCCECKEKVVLEMSDDIPMTDVTRLIIGIAKTTPCSNCKSIDEIIEKEIQKHD
jgi:hypothetical protein